jgi:FtsP/CotA-like multicopper oxidase with cupredoxin domain
VVNGRSWPYLNIEPRRYRFRFLNGCNSRFLILKMVTKPLANRPAQPALPFWQIGTDGGFLPKPVQLPQLLMGLAERADVIVDFSGLKPGTEIFLINEGPDEPFNGALNPSDPATTGQVMKFVVGPKASRDTTTPPSRLALPAITPLVPGGVSRQLSLNEADSEVLPDVGPQAAFLGTVDFSMPGMPMGMPMMWSDAVTENPAVGATELWEIYNFTGDAHPIHVHQVQFQVIGREAIGGGGSAAGSNAPLPWETGFKDTVITYPGEITRIRTKFDLPGRYVWHCHIVDHEDNEMMRPIQVVP